MRKIEMVVVVVILVLSVLGCSVSRTEMIRTHMEEGRVGKPIEDSLIIVVVDDQEIRTVFENHFKDWLNARGVDAVVSVDVLRVEMGAKLEKEAIIAVVDKHGNDTILITHLVGMQETGVFTRGRPQYFNSYYGFYNYAWGYVTWPVTTDENVQLTLETRLYDTETESLIWAGESLVSNPKTSGEAIGQVVERVISDLGESGLLPESP
jgi:hypothetical protein